MPQRTFNPHKSNNRSQGFLRRMASAAGRKVLKARRDKSRHKLVG